jgi:hypothetical protein
MTKNYPNIVPDNNLRLPDALTIKHGPARLLSTFVLEGDKAARRIGVRLRLRHDFGELAYLNKQRVAKGDWFRLVHMFNPQFCDLSPQNSYWISGENEYGEIVLSQAGRIYYWPETNLEQEARMMFYGGRDEGQLCEITAAAAKSITGVVFYGGSGWVRPDFRGQRLMQLIPRLGRAYALARWPVDWGISFVAPVLVDKGVAWGYGYKHASYSLFYPGSPWGDLEVVLTTVSASEAYDDFTKFLMTELSEARPDRSGGLPSTVFESNVTNISSDGVFHGNNNRS